MKSETESNVQTACNLDKLSGL